MNSRRESYMQDLRVRPQDAEFATLASKDLKRVDTTLKKSLSHELQT